MATTRDLVPKARTSRKHCADEFGECGLSSPVNKRIETKHPQESGRLVIYKGVFLLVSNDLCDFSGYSVVLTTPKVFGRCRSL